MKINYFAIPGIEGHSQLKYEIIISKTCEYFGVKRSNLTAKGRYRQNVTARHIAMYLIRTRTHQSLLQIGGIFNRDHTTVINAIQKIYGFLHIKDEETIKAIDTISDNLIANNC